MRKCVTHSQIFAEFQWNAVGLLRQRFERGRRSRAKSKIQFEHANEIHLLLLVFFSLPLLPVFISSVFVRNNVGEEKIIFHFSIVALFLLPLSVLAHPHVFAKHFRWCNETLIKDYFEVRLNYRFCCVARLI